MNKLMCKYSKCRIPDSATAEFLPNSFVQKVDAVHAATSVADAPIFSLCPRPCSCESID